MNPRTPGPPLVGYIEHRLNLQGRCNEWSVNKKHRLGGVDIPLQECTGTVEEPPWRNAGFFFVDKESSAEYLLALPQSLLKKACDAARFRRPVEVKGCSVVDLVSSRHDSAVLMEVHHNGLAFVSDSKAPPVSNISPLNLGQLQKAERDKEGTKRNESPESSRKEFYSVTAKVDAISPIIAAVPSDPFALIEIYDESLTAESPLSAVAVLKGPDALICHQGIQPGDTITLHHVRRQRWHVPVSFAKKGLPRLQNRSPTHVLVVDNSDAIVWNTTLQDYHNTPSSWLLSSPPMPSTPVPLESIQGLVVAHHFTKTGVGGMIALQSVEFIPFHRVGQLAQRQKPFTLYLSYYPMPPNLQMALRPGAVFRAVNVHVLSLGEGISQNSTCFYGACLRSTVTVMLCGSDTHPALERIDFCSRPADSDLSYNGTNNFRDSKKLTCSIGHSPPERHEFLLTQADVNGSSTERATYVPPTSRTLTEKVDLVTPYAFLRVQVSHMERAFRSLVQSWYEGHLSNWSVPGIALPLFDKIVKAFVGLYKDLSSKRPRTKRKARDPYAEFLDHACNEEVDPEHGASSVPRLGGCDVSWCDVHQSKNSWPAVIGLHDIRDTCIRVLRLRVGSMSKSPMQAGWTASVHLAKPELWREIKESKNGKQTDSVMFGRSTTQHIIRRLCTAGVVTSSGGSCVGSMSIADGNCQLIVSKGLSTGERSFPCNSRTVYQRGDFVVANIESCLVSCLCLGTAPVVPTADENAYVRPGRTELHLPPYIPFASENGASKPANLRSADTSSGISGSCSLFECDNLIFVASVQLRCSSLRSVDESASINNRTDASASKTRTSVRDCLSSSPAGSPFSAARCTLYGLLVRQRYKFSKLSKGTYNGCVLTVSHSPFDVKAMKEEKVGLQRLMNSISTVQSIEVKVSMHASQRKRIQMQKCMERLTGVDHGLFEDQSNLACAWWGVADRCRSCAIVAGGWDELNCLVDHLGRRSQGARVDPPGCVLVELPMTAVTSSKHGYLRCKCDIEGIQSFWADASEAQFSSGSVLGEVMDVPILPRRSMTSISYIGGIKFLPGMLDRRPVRRDLSQGQQQSNHSSASVVGEMVLSHETSWGVPVSTLSDLHWRICTDVRNHTKTELAPSLVHLVPRARLLSITFCRAQAECTRCFGTLSGSRQDKGSIHQKDRSNPTSGVVNSVSVSNGNGDETSSFWHLPLPITGEHPGPHTSRRKRIGALGTGDLITTGRMARTDLSCPNGCPPEYADIKWECSGVVDDGTGQAKLHAERDAALTLLGKGIDVRTIEEGAWKNESGVLFLKSVPPKSYVKHAIREAQSMASQLFTSKTRTKKKRRSLADRDILPLLTPQARAEYVLQWHCRHSEEPSRPLNLLCRCKPLSDEAYHLNRTQVGCTAAAAEEAVTNELASYALPPLKLNLVDSCAVNKSALESSWNLVPKC